MFEDRYLKYKKHLFVFQKGERESDDDFTYDEYYWGQVNGAKEPHGWGSPSSRWKAMLRRRCHTIFL